MNLKISLQNHSIRINNLKFFFRSGSAYAPQGQTPLVLVHGLGVSGTYMVPLAQSLADKFPIYIPDLPGFGNSQHPRKPYTLSQLSDALIRWMDGVGLNCVNMLGNSLGCQVITRLVLNNPDRVGKILLDSPMMDAGNRGFFSHFVKGLKDLPYEPISLMPILVHDYLASGPGAILTVMKDALKTPIEDDLPHVNIPALVLRGSYDTMVSQAWAEKVTQLLPNACLVVIPRAGHASNFDAPDELAERVREFLQ